MTIAGHIKTMNGQQVIVYDINGMELYVEVEALTNVSYAILLADDLKRARQVFFDNGHEDWSGVMGKYDIDEVLFEMHVLQPCPTTGCKTKRSPRTTKEPIRALPGVNGIEPVVGMGATVGVGSDSDPYTVAEVVTPHHIVIQPDNWRIISGNEGDGSAQYEYTTNPNSAPIDVTLRRDGKWKIDGTTTVVHIGNRRRYRDPGF